MVVRKFIIPKVETVIPSSWDIYKFINIHHGPLVDKLKRPLHIICKIQILAVTAVRQNTSGQSWVELYLDVRVSSAEKSFLSDLTSLLAAYNWLCSTSDRVTPPHPPPVTHATQGACLKFLLAGLILLCSDNFVFSLS